MAADSPLFRFQTWRAALPPALRLLLTVNIATYLAYVVIAMLALFGAAGLERAVMQYLTLPAAPGAALAVPWTVLTYAFVNAFPGFFGLISFAFGFYWLQWMGRDVEETYGPHRLFGVYVLSALLGAVVGLALGALLPLPRLFYFGLWTPVTGVLCYTAALQPNRGVGLFFLGVVPMKWLAVGFVVLSLAFSADLTVLGAALAGVLAGRGQRAGRDLTAWAAPLFGRRRASRPAPRNPFARAAPVPAKTAGRRAGRASRPARDAPLDVDAILDKILEKGYDSLTKEEREALDRASRD